MKLLIAAAAATAIGATAFAGLAPAVATTPAPHTVRPLAPAHISIKNFGFHGTFSVKKGQKVIVTNNDSTTHTLTSNGGRFNTGRIAPHHSKSFIAPRTVGHYGFHCAIHTDMKGTLTVHR